MAEEIDAPLCLPPRPLRNSQGLRLPAGTCDTHFHVFAPEHKLAHPRSYTPQMETLDGWLALAESFAIARGVLVQPSVYGLDNDVLLEALARHPDRLRGVVVVAAETPPERLRQLDRQGVRAIRINLRNKAGIGFAALEMLAPQIRALGWHVVFQIGPVDIDTVVRLTERHGLAGVIDHLAFMPLDSDPGRLLRALDTGRVHVKISAPYRLRGDGRMERYTSLVSTLADHAPHRLLWGTDWPHTELFQSVPEEDELIALTLAGLTPGARQQVLVENPQKLYFSH